MPPSSLVLHCYFPSKHSLHQAERLRTKNLCDQQENRPGSRFNSKGATGKIAPRAVYERSQSRCPRDSSPLVAKHNLTEAECGLRWISHLSVLKTELGDAVIVGASRTSQLEENLADLEKVPLPGDVVEALNDGWDVISGIYQY